MKKNATSAFTLIEILVVIVIVAIIALWANNMNFNTLSEKQKLETMAWKVISNFETVRGNALMWRWIWASLYTPESYQIDFTTTTNGSIITQYFDSTSTLQDYTEITAPTFLANTDQISLIRCLKLDESEDDVLLSSETAIITIKWPNMSLEWDCDTASSKILELTLKRKAFTETIQINTLTWLVSKK